MISVYSRCNYKSLPSSVVFNINRNHEANQRLYIGSPMEFYHHQFSILTVVMWDPVFFLMQFDETCHTPRCKTLNLFISLKCLYSLSTVL